MKVLVEVLASLIYADTQVSIYVIPDRALELNRPTSILTSPGGFMLFHSAN